MFTTNLMWEKIVEKKTYLTYEEFFSKTLYIHFNSFQENDIFYLDPHILLILNIYIYIYRIYSDLA